MKPEKKQNMTDLLALLACPACQGDVQLKDDKIICLGCKQEYPIVNGIPVLLT